jgi:hypothetical protein
MENMLVMCAVCVRVRTPRTRTHTARSVVFILQCVMRAVRAANWFSRAQSLLFVRAMHAALRLGGVEAAAAVHLQLQHHCIWWRRCEVGWLFATLFDRTAHVQQQQPAAVPMLRESAW